MARKGEILSVLCLGEFERTRKYNLSVCACVGCGNAASNLYLSFHPVVEKSIVSISDGKFKKILRNIKSNFRVLQFIKMNFSHEDCACL